MKSLFKIWILLVLTGCACDLTSTKSRGLRSKRYYKRYNSFSDYSEKIDTTHVYKYLYSEETDHTGNYLVGTTSSVTIYFRFFGGGRALKFQVDSDSITENSFNNDAGDMAYYRLRDEKVDIYYYVPQDCGMFIKTTATFQEDFMIEENWSSPKAYFKIDYSIPEEFIKYEKPNW